MDISKRKGARASRDQLLTLVNGWDPAGRLGAGAPRSEYDSFIDSLMDLLSRGATSDEIASFLEREVRDHFGATPKDTEHFAKKAIAWYELASREEA